MDLVYFQESPLGQLSALLPDKALSALLPQKKHPQGAKLWHSSSGKFRLMMLKHYSGLSDEKLVQHLNTDWSYQLFCQLELAEGEFIRDKSLVSKVRKEFSGLDYQNIQQVLQKHWKGRLPANEGKALLMDATCFESYLRYPTDVKLLFEGCQWLNGQLLALCSRLALARPRNHFKEQQHKYFAYARYRKKTHKQTFHEGKRLKQSVYKHQTWFGHCRFVGADAIYATNENRRFVTKNNIQTNFAKKGPVPSSGQQKQA